MSALPRLPDGFSITLNMNDVPTVIPLRILERAADRVKYTAEVPYDDDGEQILGKFAATISLTSNGQPSIHATFPLAATGHSHFDIREMIAKALSLKIS